MTRTVTIQNHTNLLAAPIRAQNCTDFWSKFRGLMLQNSIPLDGGALLAEDKSSRMNTSIHMLFMRFDIAAIWIDADRMVVDVQIARRWHLAYMPAKPARYILEAHVNQAEHFKVGDQVTFTYD
ncbi:MAG: DUF192 domain-containing protein [Bellilinea sp.]